MPKTKEIPPGGRVVTRAELTFFANACEAMMNAKIEQLRIELDPKSIRRYPIGDDSPTTPTDSEGAE